MSRTLGPLEFADRLKKSVSIRSILTQIKAIVPEQIYIYYIHFRHDETCIAGGRAPGKFPFVRFVDLGEGRCPPL